MDLRGLGGAAADLFLGAACHGCGEPGLGVCADCRHELAAAPAVQAVPDPRPPGFPLTVAAGPYGPVARRLVVAHKEESALLLTGLLADRLAVALAALLDGVAHPVLLVPVPSSAAAVRQRGFDATLALARGAARRLRRGTHRASARPLLRQSRRLADQAGLTATERAANLAGGFRLRRRVGPAAVGPLLVVVDDVVTTGASLTEAARALAAAGLPVLGAATVAATVRLHPSPPRVPPRRPPPDGARVVRPGGGY